MFGCKTVYERNQYIFSVNNKSYFKALFGNLGEEILSYEKRAK